MFTIFLLSLLACPGTSGTDPSKEGCASTAECTADLECVGPNDWSSCGMGPQEECNTDGDCPEDSRCHAVTDNCSEDGVGSACFAACEEGGCGEGFVCESGACRAVSCADEPTHCGTWQACDPSSVQSGDAVYDQHHGCINVSCLSDQDCPDAFWCVNSFCQDGRGSCQEVLDRP